MTLNWSSSEALLTIWLLVPYLAAFLAVLLPSLCDALVVLCCTATALAGAVPLLSGQTTSLQLLG